MDKPMSSKAKKSCTLLEKVNIIKDFQNGKSEAVIASERSMSKGK